MSTFVIFAVQTFRSVVGQLKNFKSINMGMEGEAVNFGLVGGLQ